MENSLAMIDDLIRLEEVHDKLFKELALRANKASLSVGESAMKKHLETLKELVQKEWDILKLKNIQFNAVIPLPMSTGVQIPAGMFPPISVSSQYQRTGCVGTRYCFKCKTIWGSTCQCIGGPCPRCKGDTMGTTPPADSTGWESHNKESWLQSASQKNSIS